MKTLEEVDSMTLEDALARIVELESQVKEQSNKYNALENVKATLEKTIQEKDDSISKLKESNMKFFTMLTAQEQQTNDEGQKAQEVQEQPVQSWDDFLAEL